MMDWISAVAHCRTHNVSCVIVMIASLEGSSPRGVGTRMVVTARDVHGTIGGGALELEGISHARALLACATAGTTPIELVTRRQMNLGKHLSQCCGGVVELQFDCLPACDFKLHIFGAGHIAQELIRLVTRIPCVTVVHDSRQEWLDKVQSVAACQPPDSSSVATCLLGMDTFTHVEALEPSSYFLVMTHSHELDLEIVEAILSRGDSAYCGLVASKSKAARFRNRLGRKGFTDREIQRLTAPVGTSVSTGNTPMEVAVASISDVLTQRTVLQESPRSAVASPHLVNSPG